MIQNFKKPASPLPTYYAAVYIARHIIITHAYFEFQLKVNF